MNQATENGKHVIFLVSQPRSGSTLLQKMLGAHPAIHTTSEPWLMLPPAYTLRDDGVEAEYDAGLAQEGLQTFIKELPEGGEDYVEGLRRMYGHLYNRVLDGTDAQVFLDKTPRYYHILPELHRIFPEARFILLFRNPLAVLSSVLRTWVQDDWLKIALYREDLLQAPGLLLKGKSELSSAALNATYESLVRSPEQEMKQICEHLGLDFRPGIIEYGDEDMSDWHFGDPQEVYEHSRPQTSSLDKWADIDNAQEWKLLYDYVTHLGPAVFEELGYDYGACSQTLESRRPSAEKLRYTFSLDWLMRKAKEDRTRWEHHTVRMARRMRKEGFRGAARHISDRIRSRFKRQFYSP